MSCFVARYHGLVHITKVLTVIDADVILHPMYFEHISRDIAAMKDLRHLPIYESCACKQYMPSAGKRRRSFLHILAGLLNHKILQISIISINVFKGSSVAMAELLYKPWPELQTFQIPYKATKHGHEGTNLLPHCTSLLTKSVLALPLQHSWCEESVELCQTVK